MHIQHEYYIRTLSLSHTHTHTHTHTHRAQQVADLKSGKEYDFLIIGGGATGCGIALDTITRGKPWAFINYTLLAPAPPCLLDGHSHDSMLVILSSNFIPRPHGIQKAELFRKFILLHTNVL